MAAPRSHDDRCRLAADRDGGGVRGRCHSDEWEHRRRSSILQQKFRNGSTSEKPERYFVWCRYQIYKCRRKGQVRTGARLLKPVSLGARVARDAAQTPATRTLLPASARTTPCFCRPRAGRGPAGNVDLQQRSLARGGEWCRFERAAVQLSGAPGPRCPTTCRDARRAGGSNSQFTKRAVANLNRVRPNHARRAKHWWKAPRILTPHTR